MGTPDSDQAQPFLPPNSLNPLIHQILQFWFLSSMLLKPVQQCQHCSQIIPSGTMLTSGTAFLILFLPWGYVENIFCPCFWFFYFWSFVFVKLLKEDNITYENAFIHSLLLLGCLLLFCILCLSFKKIHFLNVPGLLLMLC